MSLYSEPPKKVIANGKEVPFQNGTITITQIPAIVKIELSGENNPK
jgi:hypothetical protein